MKRIKIKNPMVFMCWYIGCIELLDKKFIQIDICLTGEFDYFPSKEFNKYIPEISEINFN